MSVKTEVMICTCVHPLYVLMNHSAVCLIVACVLNWQLLT